MTFIKIYVKKNSLNVGKRQNMLHVHTIKYLLFIVLLICSDDVNL